MPARLKRSQVLADKICLLISEGHSLERVISGDFGFKCNRTFVWNWIKDDPEFDKVYAQARARLADHYADKIVTMSEKTTPENASAMRVKIDTLKWVASKLLPKVYGEKPAELNVTNVNNILVIAEDRRSQLMERRRALTDQIQ